ncbi:unnamed protein product [Fraxinus pennsylvanica]|uniref:RNase H type-1 domain-containing protein n=1 Tax=Fraxinus pennsylvanica TaxID=56036 RepID=A0AAD1Z640_9LAMI|nr:unnamed protein product [Fraxinus pennsylvanica]
MDSINFVIIFAQFFNVLAWPSIPLLYPLYASIRAIKCDQESFYQQCLKYWVLFSMATILECTLSKLLVWLSLWPYIKGVATVLLTVPSFAGASYVYTHFVRIAEDSCFRDMLLIPESIGQNEFSDQASIHTRENGEESENRVAYEGKKHKLKEMEHKQKNEAATKETNISLTKKKANILLGKFNQITRLDFHNMDGFTTLVKRSNRWSMWIKPDFGWTKLNTDGSIDRETAGFGGLFRDDQGGPVCAYLLIKPDFGWTMWNSDGSIDRERAGVCGLFRDYLGVPVCAYVSKYPGVDIFLAELWAIWRGLIVASSLGIKLIWVESDSMSVVKTINKEQPYGPKASSCLKHTWKLLKKFDKYLVSHSWRETNRAADYLAKMDLPGSDVVLWPGDFPCGLSRIIKEDALGTMYYRR